MWSTKDASSTISRGGLSSDKGGGGLRDDDDLTGMLYYAYDYGCWFSYDSLTPGRDMRNPPINNLIRATSFSCAR
jgi:hypothetical protein